MRLGADKHNDVLERSVAPQPPTVRAKKAEPAADRPAIGDKTTLTGNGLAQSDLRRERLVTKYGIMEPTATLREERWAQSPVSKDEEANFCEQDELDFKNNRPSRLTKMAHRLEKLGCSSNHILMSVKA